MTARRPAVPNGEPEISGPMNVQRVVHVEWDAGTGTFKGLPEVWAGSGILPPAVVASTAATSELPQHLAPHAPKKSVSATRSITASATATTPSTRTLLSSKVGIPPRFAVVLRDGLLVIVVIIGRWCRQLVEIRGRRQRAVLHLCALQLQAQRARTSGSQRTQRLQGVAAPVGGYAAC